MRSNVKGVIQPLDPSDPRSPEHPSHARKWLDLAAALGRLMADADYDRQHQRAHDDQASRTVRKIFE